MPFSTSSLKVYLALTFSSQFFPVTLHSYLFGVFLGGRGEGNLFLDWLLLNIALLHFFASSVIESIHLIKDVISIPF